jgi:hypothetical protein
MVYDEGSEKRKPVEIAPDRVTIYYHPAPDGSIARVVHREPPVPAWPPPNDVVLAYVAVEAPPDVKYEPREVLSYVYGPEDDRVLQVPTAREYAPHGGARRSARTVYTYDALTGRLISTEEVAG